MRTFTLESGNGRKLVKIETDGPRVVVIESMSDGGTKRSEKELKSEAQARSASERMARELISRGFVEQAAPVPAMVNTYDFLDDDEEPAGVAPPVLPRLKTADIAGSSSADAPKKKKKTGKKKRRKPENGDGLDKRVIASVVGIGFAFIAFFGWFVYDSFLKPPSIVGDWRGSKLEYEISGPIVFSQYRLILDAKKHASMTLQDEATATGTYSVRGDRLDLALKDEDGMAFDLHYKITLGRSTLDLFDPSSGQKQVQLVRQSAKPATGGGPPPPPEAPSGLAAGEVGEAGQAADEQLASVAFAPKDGAFRLRHPQGWKPETGSRPDNTYSWARFSRGSAKIQVFADVAGSLMSGADSAGTYEEGSEFAPVHTAHTLYKKKAAEEFSDYNESEPTLFKGSPLGEGRIAAFTASSGGFLGSRLRGYRVTLLTNNRRLTLLCSCPEKDFEKLKPTFLAVCRSASR